MSKRISHIITDHNITVNYDGQTHIVPRTDALADKLIQALREKRTQDIPSLVSAAKRIETFGKGDFVVKDGRILINGVVAPTMLGSKILRFANEGLPHEPLVRFAENLLKNQSYRAVNELFQFLEKNDHPITDNGCFIAYKKVRSDFMDAYSGTMDNSVGKVVQMSRNLVNEDPTQTCSHGLHVANWDYANNIYSAGPNSVMLEVEVNPADVVAVPTDYDQAKMRVCRYLVLGVVDKEHSAGTSLRKTNVPCQPVAEQKPELDNVDAADDYEEEEDECCSRCGAELAFNADYDLCHSCEDEEKECSNCGSSVEYASDDLCLDCQEEEEEEEEYCIGCGEISDNHIDDQYSFLCLSCKAEEKSLDESQDQIDPYPWEDELDR